MRVEIKQRGWYSIAQSIFGIVVIRVLIFYLSRLMIDDTELVWDIKKPNVVYNSLVSSTSSLMLWLRRDSTVNIKEHLFRVQLGDKLSYALIKKTNETHYNTQYSSFQVPYFTRQGDIPPLLVALIKTLNDIITSMALLTFTMVLAADCIVAYSLTRIVKGIRELVIADRVVLSTFIQPIDRAFVDPDKPVYRVKDGGIEKRTEQLFSIERNCANDFIEPTILAAFYMLNPVVNDHIVLILWYCAVLWKYYYKKCSETLSILLYICCSMRNDTVNLLIRWDVLCHEREYHSNVYHWMSFTLQMLLQDAQMLNSLRLACLSISVSLALIPSTNEWVNSLNPMTLALYIFIQPSFNVISAAIVLAVVSFKSQCTCLQKNNTLGLFLFSHKTCHCRDGVKQSLRYVLSVAASLIFFYSVSYWICRGSWIFFEPSVVNPATSQDLLPNLSLFWYMQQLTPRAYRSFYYITYNLLGSLIILLCSIKFYRYPVTSVQIMIATFLLFQAYCTLLDFVFIYSIFLLDYPVFKKIRLIHLQISLWISIALLLQVKNYMWMHRYTENPNVSYIAQMILCGATSGLLLQFTQSALTHRLGEHRVQEAKEA